MLNLVVRALRAFPHTAGVRQRVLP